MEDFSYLGSGLVYIRERGVPGAILQEVGNCGALNLAVTEEVKELKDFTQPGGGTFNEVRRITAVELSATLYNLSAENLARAVYGSSSTASGGPVTGESIIVGPGGLALLAKLPAGATATVSATPGDTAATRANSTAYALGAYLVPATPNGWYYKVTTAGTSGNSIPTFPTVAGETVTDGTAVLTCAGRVDPVVGTDFDVRAGGIYGRVGRVIAGEAWTVGYTASAAKVVEALTSAAKEYELVFDGLNEARSGKRTRVHVYRVKLSALQNLGLIGEEYAAMEVSGKLLKDTAIVAVGRSQYFKADIED